jgi:hypothetical protein
MAGGCHQLTISRRYRRNSPGRNGIKTFRSEHNAACKKREKAFIEHDTIMYFAAVFASSKQLKTHFEIHLQYGM